MVRMARIDQEIRGGGWPNATTLARLLEVNPRTVHRDIDCLRDQLGAPIVYDPLHNGYSYNDPSYRIPFQQVTEGEFVALFLAERLLRQYHATPFAADLARIFRKFAAFCDGPMALDPEHLAQAYAIRQKPPAPAEVERFRQLHRAVREGRRLELVYYTASRDLTQRRVVDPYGLALTEDWYLVAFCHLREDVRIFAPGRIQELQETGERFERPADFNLQAYLDQGFKTMRGLGPPQTVRLRFAPAAAIYVREKKWHPTQKITENPDGGLTLEFRVNHLLEVKRWVMSFGAECEVVEPEELRDEIGTEIRKMLARYSSPNGK
jgi:predicted DNA-binding transcriptional regulator YafY